MLENLVNATSARQAALLADADRKVCITKELEKQICEKIVDSIAEGRYSCYLQFADDHFDAEEQFQLFAEKIEPRLRDLGYTVHYYRTEIATSAWVRWYTV